MTDSIFPYILASALIIAFIYSFYWQNKRKAKVFENACKAANLQPVTLDENGKQVMLGIIEKVMAGEFGYHIKIEKAAHNPDNGDFLCLVHYDERCLRRADAMEGTVLAGVRPDNNGSRRRMGDAIIMGRKLAQPILPQAVYYCGFADSSSYDYVRNINKNGTSGKNSGKSVHSKMTEYEKLFIASRETELPGITPIRSAHDVLAGLIIRSDTKIDDDALVNAVGENYWQQLNPQSGRFLGRSLVGWHVGFLPEWVMGVGRISMIKPDSPAPVWNKLLKR